MIEAAHARQKLAVVHIGSATGAFEALVAGADGLAHLSPEMPVSAALVELAQRRTAFVIPTLSLNESLGGIASGASLVADERLSPFLSDFSAKNLTRRFRLDDRHQYGMTAVFASVLRLHRAGVAILAGTDAPVPGTAHGASLHRELELLVQAGLSPVEALRAATSAPARAFALEDRGRLAVGRRADLLLVDGDPTTDILNTRRIVEIWKLGRSVDREGYRATLTRPSHRLPLGGMLFAAMVVLSALAVLARRRRWFKAASNQQTPLPDRGDAPSRR